MPDDFTDGEVLTAVDFNRVKNYWVSNTFPDAAVSAAAQDGDVVFVLDNADTVPNTLVALWDTDIDIENLATGQALVYDATAGMWSNTNVDVSSEISSLQSQIDSNSASISSLSTTVSGNTTSINNNTTNISNLSGTVSSLSSTVDTHTTQITALEEGGGGGGSATLWSGTVTGIINGDQQTVEVAAGEPINATIIAANKTPDFVYIGDKVIGGNLDGGYAILSREFNYPDMPAFDPTGGLTQNGAQQGLPVNNGNTNRLWTYGNGNTSQSEAVIANYDTVAGNCFWNLSNSATLAYYTAIADASFAGTIPMPEAIFKPIDYSGYALFPSRGDNNTSRVWYWDWNVQDMGELVGLQDATVPIMDEYAAGDSNWEAAVTPGNLTYDTVCYVADDGKLNAVVGVSPTTSHLKMIVLHLTYEYASNPMSGTWTVKHHVEVGGRQGQYTYFKPASDNTGTLFSRRTNSTGSTVSFFWWNYEDDSFSTGVSSSNYPWLYYGGNTCLPKTSARPYSVGTIFDGGTNLYLEFRDLKNESTTTIDLDEFPSSTYETWINISTQNPRATQMRDGYLIACLRNKTTDVFEFWKFDLFGQANKIGEGITPPPASYIGHATNNIWSYQGGGSANSPTIGFFPPEDTTRPYSSNSWTQCSIYWVDGSA